MPQTFNPQQITPDQAQQAQQAVREALQEANLPAEKLIEIGEWAQRVISNPGEFGAFRAWLKEQGLPDSEIPKKPDYQELMSMVVIGHVASQMEGQPAQPEATAPTGPVSPDQLAAMAGQGRNGDTMLAHINPEEAAVLKQMGGTGTINPATGLPEYGFFSDLWRGVKNVFKKVAPFVLPIVAIAFPALIPAVGTALGASAALAPVVGAAAIAGGVTALSGGSIKEVLSSAALTGLGAYLTPIVGKYVGSAAGITSPTLQSAIGSATLAGGFTALRGGTVSQVLHAAATGAAANYLGQIATNAINSNLITNTKITQSTFDDAVFAAADAEQLYKQGLGKNAITEVLKSTGLTTQVAADAANLAAAGKDATAIATSLSNKYAGMKIDGKTTLYQNGQTGVQNSVLGGGNVKALETLQGTEDAYLVANDAAQLKAQGLNEAAIKQNLIAAGVDPKIANWAAYNAVTGTNVDAMTSGMVDTFKNQQIFTDAVSSGTTTRQLGGDASTQTSSQTGGTQTGTTTTTTTTAGGPPAGVSADAYADYEFAAADAAQLKAQGASAAAIQQNLQAAGVDPAIARQVAYYANLGVSANNIAQTVAGQFQGREVFTGTTGTTTTTGGTQQGGTQQGGSTATTTTPVNPNAETIADAEFIAADAAQLAKQGLSQAAIEQNLIAYGTNPNAAYAAAYNAVRGASESQIASNLARQFAGRDIFSPTETTQDPYEVDGAQGSRTEDTALTGGGTTQDPYEVDGAQGSRTEDTALVGTETDPYGVDGEQGSRTEDTALVGTETDPYGVDGEQGSRTEDTALVGTETDPYGVDGEQGSRTEDTALVGTDTGTTGTDTGTTTLTPIDTGTIVATPVITDAATDDKTQTPKTDYGKFTPAPPDASWSIPLQYPGLNPGLVGAAVAPAYATTSPVQSQYYWGRQPYFGYAEDLNNYNQVNMPVQPWGLQQGYWEQPLTTPQTYGENMFVQPQAYGMTASQPATRLAPVAYAQPVSPQALASIQGIAPAYTLPAAPNYVYNVAPTVDQYSIPAMAPV